MYTFKTCADSAIQICFWPGLMLDFQSHRNKAAIVLKVDRPN